MAWPSKGLSAVGYIRMSSDEQEHSPEQQRVHIERLAAKLQCRIVRWYQDLGISGDDIQRRTAFRRMVADAGALRDFNLILCWSQDRFGRFDAIEAGEWVAPLRRAGVQLVTVAEGSLNWTDTAGRLVYTIQQEGKNTYLLDMARNCARGRTQAARKIGFVGGRVPYGYVREIVDEQGRPQRRLGRHDKFRCPRDWKSLLVLSGDKAEVATVKWVFQRYCQGATVYSIAHRLNARGIPSAKGKHWTATGIRNMLRNPVYVGDQVWNRRHIGKYFAIADGEVISEGVRAAQRGARVSKQTLNPTADWVIVRDAHPGIVSRKLFEQAGRRLEKRLGRPYQRPGLPLTGLVKCGHCGMTMTYHHYKAAYQGTPHAYYRLTCPSRCQRGKEVCSSRMIREPWLLAAVTRILETKLIGPDVEGRLRKRLSNDLGLSRISAKGLRNIKQELNRLNTSIERGTENLLRAGPRSVLAAAGRLEEWHQQREKLLKLIAQHDAAETGQKDAALTEVMADIRVLRAGLQSTERELLHHTLLRLIDKITLWFKPKANLKSSSKCEIARGVIEAKCPYVDGTYIRETFNIGPGDLDEGTPRWYRKLRGLGVGERSASRHWAVPSRVLVSPTQVRVPASLA